MVNRNIALGFQIVELVEDKSLLINREQFWLNKLFNHNDYAKNTLNILLNANNWLGHKHKEESKVLMSIKKMVNYYQKNTN